MIWAAVCIAVVAALIFVLRIGISFEYSDKKAKLHVKIGPFMLPVKQGKKKKNKTKKDEEKSSDTSKPKLHIFLDIVGKLRRKLVVDELCLRYQSACDDPADAALAYGAASAAVGLIMPPLNEALNIKKLDLRTGVSFTESESRIYVKATTTIPVYTLFSLAFFYLREKNLRQKNSTEVS